MYIVCVYAPVPLTPMLFQDSALSYYSCINIYKIFALKL